MKVMDLTMKYIILIGSHLKNVKIINEIRLFEQFALLYLLTLICVDLRYNIIKIVGL